jgi:hypothetical protein
VSESDRQHGNGHNNRQLAKASTSTRPFLAISRAVGFPKFSSAADAELKVLIPANLNRSENKPGNQKPKSKQKVLENRQRNHDNRETKPAT